MRDSGLSARELSSFGLPGLGASRSGRQSDISLPPTSATHRGHGGGRGRSEENVPQTDLDRRFRRPLGLDHEMPQGAARGQRVHTGQGLRGHARAPTQSTTPATAGKTFAIGPRLRNRTAASPTTTRRRSGSQTAGRERGGGPWVAAAGSHLPPSAFPPRRGQFRGGAE